jgi:hypothetical protein
MARRETAGGAAVPFDAGQAGFIMQAQEAKNVLGQRANCIRFAEKARDYVAAHGRRGAIQK